MALLSEDAERSDAYAPSSPSRPPSWRKHLSRRYSSTCPKVEKKRFWMLSRLPRREQLQLWLSSRQLDVRLEIIQACVSFVACIIYIVETYYSYLDEDLFFKVIEKMMGVYFFLDFLLNFYLAPHKLRFIFTLSSILDLCTIIPAFVYSLSLSVDFPDTLWILRLFRVFRLLRLMRMQRFISGVTESNYKLELYSFVLLLIALIVCFAGVMQVVERDQNLQFHEVLYWIVVTLSTVGYGDVVPQTTWGQVLIIVFIVTVLVFLPPQISKLHELSNNNEYRGALGYRIFGGESEHIVVCGNITAASLHGFLCEFFSSGHGRHHICVAILNQEKPTDAIRTVINSRKFQGRISYFIGSAMVGEDLRRVRLNDASACFILADKQSETPDEQDAGNVLRALSVRNHGESTIIFIQLVRPENKPDMETAIGVDYTMFMHELKYGILAQGCLCPGSCSLISNIMRSADPRAELEAVETTMGVVDPWMDEYIHGLSHEIYPVILTAAFDGVLFRDAARSIFRRFSAILLAVQSFDGTTDDKPPVHSFDNVKSFQNARRKCDATGIQLNPSNHPLREGQLAFILAFSAAEAQTIVGSYGSESCKSTKNAVPLHGARPAPASLGIESLSQLFAAFASPPSPTHSMDEAQVTPGVFRTPSAKDIQRMSRLEQDVDMTAHHRSHHFTRVGNLRKSTVNDTKLRMEEAQRLRGIMAAPARFGLASSLDLGDSLVVSGVPDAVTASHKMVEPLLEMSELSENGEPSPEKDTNHATAAEAMHPLTSKAEEVPVDKKSADLSNLHDLGFQSVSLLTSHGIDLNAPSAVSSSPSVLVPPPPLLPPKSNMFSDPKMMLASDAVENRASLKSRTLQNCSHLGGHVIVAGSMVDLHYFIPFLRESSLIEHRAVVILHPSPPSVETWFSISAFTDIYYLKGSPLVYRDLIRAAVHKADQVVILANESSARLSDEQLYDYETIMTSLSVEALCRSANEIPQPEPQNTSRATASVVASSSSSSSSTTFKQKQQRSPTKAILVTQNTGPSVRRQSLSGSKERNKGDPFVIINLLEGDNIRFLKPSLAGLKQHWLCPTYAAGRVYLDSSLDALIAQAFFNPSIIPVIQLLVSGPATGSTRPSFLTRVPLPPQFVDKEFAAVFDWFLSEKHILTVGIYRSKRLYESPLSYVYTCPRSDSVMHEDDFLFILTAPSIDACQS